MKICYKYINILRALQVLFSFNLMKILWNINIIIIPIIIQSLGLKLGAEIRYFGQVHTLPVEVGNTWKFIFQGL